MLKTLTIKNYALIRGLEISPASGLNMVTGETGAGKSIILGAAGLLLGKRADTKVLMDKDEKCVIEGVFNIEGYDLGSLFGLYDIEYEEDTIIRREINANGKSRAFINDSPVRLDVLMIVGSRLLDIHSQHDTLKVGDKSIQLKILDDYASNGERKLAYKSLYKGFKSLEKHLEDLLEKKSLAQKESDYHNYLLEELAKVNLISGEQTDLENELGILDNAEDIKLKLGKVATGFLENELSIQDQLGEVNGILHNLSGISAELDQLSTRFASGFEELKDVIRDVERIQESVEYDPQKIEEIKQRLGIIYELQQKHQVNTVEDLLKIQEELESEFINLEALETEINATKSSLDKSKKGMMEKAESLSGHRREMLDDLASALNKQLQLIGMPDAHVEIAYKRIDPSENGIDEITILFSANKGIAPQPVQEVASGGEFSRLMFCVKYLLADKTALPTVIFDEIDTGVSGEIAKKLADMMVKMAERHQVITISHLPQIAAKGDAHYFVYKDNSADRTESLIRKLTEEDRLSEIAKMIGGNNPSAAAIDNARELIME